MPLLFKLYFFKKLYLRILIILMKKLKIRQLACILLIMLAEIMFQENHKLYAADVYGSDISWIVAGKDSIIVSYEVITDCRSSSTNSAKLTFRYKTGGALIHQEVLTAKSTIDVTGCCPKQCSKCDPGCSSFGYGLRKMTYTKLFIFKNLTDCEIIVSPNVESRSYSINTGLGGKGFYTYAIINRCVSDSNRSPFFSGTKTVLCCTTSDIVIDAEMINAANDSIVFSLVSPMSDSAHTLSYSGQYSFDKPLEFWGFPNNNQSYPLGFKLDSKTGIISFRPMKACETMFCVNVKIYRKGNLIGETRREMGVIVINCPINNFPTLTGPSMMSVCAGSEIKLNYTSKDLDSDDSVNFYIVHQLNNISWQTTNQQVKHSSAEFKWIPTRSDISKTSYEVFVIARDNNCPVSAQIIRRVLLNVYPDTLKADLEIIKKSCGEYEFKAKMPAKLYNYKSVWTGNGDLYSTEDSFLFKYHKPGKYFVNHTIVADSACSENQIKYIQTDSFIYVDLPSDTNICFGDSILISPFVGNSKGRVKYLWNTNDTNNTIQTSAITNSTSYSIFVSDTSQCISTDTMVVNPGNFIFFYGIPPLCENEDSFDIRPFVTPAGGKWSSVNKKLLNKNSYYVHPKKVGQGDYWLKYEYTEPNSLCHSVDSTMVTINPSPTSVSTIKLPVLCRNSSPLDLNPYGVPSGGDWRCSYSAGENNNILTPSNMYSGSFKLFYTYYNQFGCELTDTQSIYIHPSVTMSFNTEDNKTTYCSEKVKIKLNASPAGGQIICPGWIIDSCYFSPSKQNDSFSQVKVIYRYKHSTGCEVERSLNLNIFHKPEIQIQKLKSLYPGELSPYVSIGSTVRYANGVQWNMVPGQSSGSISPSYFDKKINYTTAPADLNRSFFTLSILSLGHNNQCISAKDTQKFVICNSLEANFKISDKNPYLDSTVSFTNLSIDKVFEISNHKWHFGDGDSSETDNPVYSYSKEGKYFVTYTVTNNQGCVSVKTDSVLAREFISVNNDQSNELSVKVYNYENQFTVSVNSLSKQPVNLSLYNGLGQQIFNQLLSENNTLKIVKTDFRPGIYFLKIMGDKELPLCIKLLM